MEATTKLGIPLVALLLLGAPGASAWQVVTTDWCDNAPEAPDACESLLATLRAPCVTILVVTPTETIDQRVLTPRCDRTSRLDVQVDAERAWGSFWVPLETDDALAPLAPDAPAPPPVPAARAGFGVGFEARFAPCADPVLHAEGEARASAAEITPVATPVRQGVSASPACAAAEALASGSEAAALDLFRALVAAVLGVEPPALDLPDPGSADAGGLSGHVAGEASTREPPTADADTDAETPTLPGIALALPPAAPEDDAPAPPPMVAPRADEPAATDARALPPLATNAPVPTLDSAPSPSAAPAPAPLAPRPSPAAPVEAQAVAADPQPARPQVVAVAGLALAPLLLREAFALYSRIRRDQVLDHPVRRRVHEAVRARPAAAPSEIARALGVDAGTVRYHLETLRRNGAIGRVESARGPLFHALERRDEALRVAPEPLPSRILALVACAPGLTTSELARRLGVSKRAAQNHALDLLAAGRLEHRRDAGARRLYPAAEAFMRATTPRETT